VIPVLSGHLDRDIATADGYGEQLSHLKIEHIGLDSGDMGAAGEMEIWPRALSASEVAGLNLS
jgi:hypothetical protein